MKRLLSIAAVALAVALAVAAAAACGTNATGAGGKCSASSDCSSGLDCLDVAQFSGSACTVIGKACSIACGSNADCASLGSGFDCFAGCGSQMFCGATL